MGPSLLLKNRDLMAKGDRESLNLKSPQFGQPPAGFGCNEGWFCSCCLLPSVSFSASAFSCPSLCSTADGTDNRSLPGGLALKYYPSC